MAILRVKPHRASRLVPGCILTYTGRPPTKTHGGTHSLWRPDDFGSTPGKPDDRASGISWIATPFARNAAKASRGVPSPRLLPQSRQALLQTAKRLCHLGRLLGGRNDPKDKRPLGARRGRTAIPSLRRTIPLLPRAIVWCDFPSPRPSIKHQARSIFGQVQISRISGQMGTRRHFSGQRADQDLIMLFFLNTLLSAMAVSRSLI